MTKKHTQTTTSSFKMGKDILDRDEHMEVSHNPSPQKYGLVYFKKEKTPIVLFTREYGVYDTHYLNYGDNFKGYVRCNHDEGECVLDIAGIPRSQIFVIPAYLVVKDKIGLVPISSSDHKGALFPQIRPILQLDKKKRRIVVYISKPTPTTFEVQSEFLTNEFRSKLRNAIREYKEDLDNGEINFESFYPRLSNEELARIPEIEVLLRLKGHEIGYCETEEDDDAA